MNHQGRCPSAEQLREMLAGTLPEAEQLALPVHVEGCGRCQRNLDELSGGSWAERARELKDAPPKDAALAGVVHDALSRTVPGARSDQPAGTSEDLSFLARSDRPGMLGRLGGYHIQEVIGKGGMGVVFKAIDEKLERVVALKAMTPQLATSATARQRFNREAKAAAAVSHDHVVAIHAVSDETEPVPYLVMQLVAGQSLQDKLDRQGAFEVKEILRIGLQIAEGLAAAHKQGLVHRDIKPANILLENGVERVKITDFGLARAFHEVALTQSGVVTGTPQYMAPEQAAGEQVDHRADLFSLGSVLYAMCTGRPPFRADGTLALLKRVAEETPRPIRDVNPDIPEWLERIVAKLHAKKPAHRFQTAREVAELLGQHLAHLQQPEQTPRPAPVEPPRPPAVAGAGASTEGKWRIGDRVLAPWEPEWLYPATVREINGDSIYVWFDDGELAWVESDDLKPLDLGEGSRVFGPWGYCGVVTERLGNRVHLHYDDGDEEWTDLKDIYLPSGKPPVPASPWKHFLTYALLVLAGLAFAEWRGWINLRGYVLRWFDQVVALDVEEPPVEVKVFETADKHDDPKGGFSIRMRSSGLARFGPAQHFIVDGPVKTLRLSPGNYWLMASRDGRVVHRELIKAQRGAESIVRIPKAGDKQEGLDDAAKLQGKWLVQTQEKAGQALDANASPPWIEFVGTRFRIKRGEGAVTEQVFAIDPTKSPKQLYLFGVGSNAHEGSGNYKIENDTLTLCIAEPGAAWPVAFQTLPGSKHTLTVCRRAPSP
jgi:serine/threonine-protein kinase